MSIVIPEVGETHVLGGDLKEMSRNPAAVLGGLTGTVLLCGAMVVGLLVMAKEAQADESETDAVMDFVPGALVKLGTKAPEEDIPEKVITNETRAEDDAVEQAVTEDEEVPVEEKEKEDKPEKAKKPTPKKDKKLPTSKLPTDKKNPYDDKTTDARETSKDAKDLPNLQDGHSPFGSPDGWSDMMKDTNPWAMAVSKRLQGLQLGVYGSKGQGGTYRFQMGIGKDGRVCLVRSKGGSLPPSEQKLLALELERIKFPSPPPAQLKKMGKCTKIQYVFTWSPKGVK